MSAEHTPVLSSAIPLIEMFMSEWEELGDDYPHLQRWTDAGLKSAKKYYNHMDYSKAYAIAMCKS